VSDTVDRHIAKAFASLADVSVRELEATAEAVSSRRHPLHDFAGVFREVAWSRENGSDPSLARFHVREYAERADEDFLELLAEAEAPFWAHVREAILASQQERVA
jgi:DNA-binding transcriptional regulator YbjK